MTKTVDWESRIGRRLRLRDLHVFFAVVRSGSMVKAAAHLRITQPSVSKAIGDLEAALGVRLFDRSPQGVAPTMYGTALLKCGAAVFDELRQGIRNIEFLADPTAGELKIGCPESIVGTLLPNVMERFSERYPRVVLHVSNVPTPAIDDPGLRDRKYDLVLARLLGPLSDLADDLNADILIDDPVVVAAGMHSRWARRRKIDLAELINEPWMLSPPGTWTYTRIVEAFRAQGLDLPQISLLAYSTPLVTHFLANGPYITAYARSVIRFNSLKELPVDLPVRPWPIAIVTLKNRTLSPLVERFIACAREMAKSVGGSRRGHIGAHHIRTKSE